MSWLAENLSIPTSQQSGVVPRLLHSAVKEVRVRNHIASHQTQIAEAEKQRQKYAKLMDDDDDVMYTYKEGKGKLVGNVLKIDQFIGYFPGDLASAHLLYCQS